MRLDRTERGPDDDEEEEVGRATFALTMPKRKANESADDAVGLGGEKRTIPPNDATPPPRKRGRREALAAAKDWHDARSTASSGGGGGAPAGPGVDQSTAEDAISPRRKGGREALAAAREWHDARSSSTSSGGVAFATAPRRTGAVDDGGKVVGVPPRSVASSSRSDEYECAPPVVDVAVAAPPAVRKPDDNISNQSALYRDALPTMGVGGGNAFLKSLRGVGGDMKVSTSRSENTTATATMTTSIAESMGGSTSTYSSSTRLAYPAKDFLGIVGKSLLFLALFALNITTAIVAIVVIRGSSSSFDALRDRHASEVDALVTRISKSREMEALLRSGVGVLEREMQARRNAGGGIDSDDVRAMYGIRTESSIDDAADYDIQSVEERNDWLEGMRALEEERSLGLEKLNAMRIALFEDGRF